MKKNSLLCSSRKVLEQWYRSTGVRELKLICMKRKIMPVLQCVHFWQGYKWLWHKHKSRIFLVTWFLLALSPIRHNMYSIGFVSDEHTGRRRTLTFCPARKFCVVLYIYQTCYTRNCQGPCKIVQCAICNAPRGDCRQDIQKYNTLTVFM